MPSGTPIIIDVDGHGYDLTSATDGVVFDFTGTYNPGKMSWTAKGSRNGFLVRDHYGTGEIVDGKEMFGNLTEQPKCGSPNGFLALAQYDKNGDGWIDENDEIWNELLVWQDLNHNGMTDPGELHSLKSLGIRRIGIRYTIEQKRDAYGNMFHYKGRIDDKSSDKSLYDVVLLPAP